MANGEDETAPLARTQSQPSVRNPDTASTLVVPPPTPGQETPGSPASPQPERLIANRYCLLAEIGRGGMGVVWRAEDRVIGRHVAVKEMRLASEVSPDMRAEYEERILREARTAGRLNDPAIVTVFDVVHDNGSIFIVMELVDAPTLSAMVRSQGPLAPALVADIGRQVLAALEAAHAAGVVHRDVKPSNILVLANGRPKLTDFGIAQAADDPTLTKTGMVVGSPAYLAPERLSGREASPASDIWALGAVLYFAVEGKGAFERETTAATLSAVLSDVPYLTRGQGPLAAAVSGMLAPAPEGRLTAARLRPLLNAAVSEQVGGVPNQTMVMGAGGVPTQGFDPATALVGGDRTAAFGGGGGPGTSAFGGGGHQAALVGSGNHPSGGSGARRRLGRVVIGGSLALAAILAATTATIGYGKGKSAQKTTDAKPSDSVVVLYYGVKAGPNTITYGVSNYYYCGVGTVPMAPGNDYSQGVNCSEHHNFRIFTQVDMGFDKAPYPSNTKAFEEAAKAVCYHETQINGRYVTGATIGALLPTKDVWTATNVPQGWSADRDVICVEWTGTGMPVIPTTTATS